MKEFKTLSEQIDLLKTRGLAFNDVSFALTKLQEDNYYSIINGYKYLFVDKSNNDMFKPGVSFEEIYALFEFDRSIKAIMVLCHYGY